MHKFHRDTCVRSYEKHMIEANRQYWKDKPNVTEGKKWIYSYHSMPEYLNYPILEDIYAKGLQAKERLPIISVSFGSSRKAVAELDKSFGINDIASIDFGECADPVSRIKTYIVAKHLTRTTYKKREKFIHMKYRGISCGNELYDAIIRANLFDSDEANFDCFDVDRETFFQYIRQSLFVIEQSYRLLKKRPPAYIIVSEDVYVKGLVVNIAAKFGAKILVPRVDAPEFALGIRSQKRISSHDRMRRQIEAHEELASLKDKETQDLFVLNTGTKHQEDLFDKLGIDKKKKNVFIMLHALADGPREARNYNIYFDYNQWYIETLRIIAGIPDVNWIIKDHPMAAFFRQDNYVKSTFEKYKTSNMFWCDKSVSGIQIMDIADCVVTCAGDVGIEYWSYGIPTITTGDTYYTDWGISYKMESIEQYESALKHVENLEKPSEDSMNLARRYLKIWKGMGEPKDALAKILGEMYSEILKAAMEMGSYETNDYMYYRTFKKYIQHLREKGIESSDIYQLKNVDDVSAMRG